MFKKKEWIDYYVTPKGGGLPKHPRTFHIDEVYINKDFQSKSKFPNVAIIRLDKDSVPNFPTFIPSWGNPDLPIKSIWNLYYVLLLSGHKS